MAERGAGYVPGRQRLKKMPFLLKNLPLSAVSRQLAVRLRRFCGLRSFLFLRRGL